MSKIPSFRSSVRCFLGMIQFFFFFPERVFLPNTTSHRTQLHPPIPQRPGAGEGGELGSHGQALWPRGTPTGQQLFVGRAVFLGDFQESSTRPGLSLTDESCAFPRNLWCWQSRRPSPSPGRPQPHPRWSHPDHRLGGQGHRLRYRGSQHEGEGEVQDQGWGAVAGEGQPLLRCQRKEQVVGASRREALGPCPLQGADSSCLQ